MPVNATRRARRPASKTAIALWLPDAVAGAVVLAAAATGGGAGAGGSATSGLDDVEVVAALGVGSDRVAVDSAGRDLDLTGACADVETGGAELAGRVTRHVRLRVGEARLDLADHVASIRLGRSVLALL